VPGLDSPWLETERPLRALPLGDREPLQPPTEFGGDDCAKDKDSQSWRWKMRQDQQSTLDALKFELNFLESGGYGHSVREPRRELSIFQDSPSCLNYGSPVRKTPCSECFLMDFVPPEKRREAIPCHHIPLNEHGDTVASLGERVDDFRFQERMRRWLREKIEELQASSAKVESEVFVL
jgi:hypothetical protein